QAVASDLPLYGLSRSADRRPGRPGQGAFARGAGLVVGARHLLRHWHAVVVLGASESVVGQSSCAGVGGGSWLSWIATSAPRCSSPFWRCWGSFSAWHCC